MNRYLRIKWPQEDPFTQYSCDGTDSLGELSLVNVLIGPNNSGKSRFLRSLFALPKYPHIPSATSARPFHELAKALKPDLDKVYEGGITSIDNIGASHLNGILAMDDEFMDPENPINETLENSLKELTQASGGSVSGTGPGARGADGNKLAGQLREVGEKGLSQLQAIDFDPEVSGDRRFYIPILRGMRPLDQNQQNFYRDRTVLDYFSANQLPEKFEIYTGIELYQVLKGMLLGDPEQRDAVRDFETFLSDRFFRRESIALIPREGDTIVHIKIGDEDQLPIYNLGDGLQSLLICIFRIFMEPGRCLFFLEEPDMCMHPSLQRSLLEVLGEFPQHQYFITTHSNHFLDMALDFSDMSIFHFRKIEKNPAEFQISLASSRDHNMLRDLGVRNSSLFLTNATIWVEGITDRLYLREYMKKYVEELKTKNPDAAEALAVFKEDYHYAFIEYQGSNITHWSFDPNDTNAQRIKASFVCGNAILIADGDIASKGGRKDTYEEMLQDRFVMLNQKEIENLIPQQVLREIVRAKFDGNEKDPKLVSYTDYSKKGVALGTYLDKILEPEEGTVGFASPTGTVRMKVDFCEQAVAYMNEHKDSWELGDDINELCRKIFDHIAKQNQ